MVNHMKHIIDRSSVAIVGMLVIVGTSWILSCMCGIPAGAQGIVGAGTSASYCSNMAQGPMHARRTQTWVAKPHRSRGIASAALLAAAANLSALVVAYLLSQCLRSTRNKHVRSRFLAGAGRYDFECGSSGSSDEQDDVSDEDTSVDLSDHVLDTNGLLLRQRPLDSGLNEGFFATLGGHVPSVPPLRMSRRTTTASRGSAGVRALQQFLLFVREGLGGKSISAVVLNMFVALAFLIAPTVVKGVSQEEDLGLYLWGFGVVWAFVAWLSVVRTIYAHTKYYFGPDGPYGPRGPHGPQSSCESSQRDKSREAVFITRRREHIWPPVASRSEAMALVCLSSLLAFASLVTMVGSVREMHEASTQSLGQYTVGAFVGGVVFSSLAAFATFTAYWQPSHDRMDISEV